MVNATMVQHRRNRARLRDHLRVLGTRCSPSKAALHKLRLTEQHQDSSLLLKVRHCVPWRGMRRVLQGCIRRRMARSPSHATSWLLRRRKDTGNNANSRLKLLRRHRMDRTLAKRGPSPGNIPDLGRGSRGHLGLRNGHYHLLASILLNHWRLGPDQLSTDWLTEASS